MALLCCGFDIKCSYTVSLDDTILYDWSGSISKLYCTPENLFLSIQWFKQRHTELQAAYSGLGRMIGTRVLQVHLRGMVTVLYKSLLTEHFTSFSLIITKRTNSMLFRNVVRRILRSWNCQKSRRDSSWLVFFSLFSCILALTHNPAKIILIQSRKLCRLETFFFL